MIPRNLTRPLLAALRDSPVVFLQGARQTGKSTLVQALAKKEHPARYVTLDDTVVLAAARSDPQGFISCLEGSVVLDEVQRAPELALAIKVSVDVNRRAGRFLLTGSAGVLHLPRIADSLAGRIEILTLWPFSQGEIERATEGFIDALFRKKPGVPSKPGEDLTRLVGRIVRGGFPDALRRSGEDRRRAWFTSYVSTILQRDVRDLANIEGLTDLPRLLALLATRTGSLLNYADLSRSLSLPQTTLKRYLSLLQTILLIQPLPAWSSNLGLRLIKSPKLYFVDSGLLVHLLGGNARALHRDRTLLGHVVENFVVLELHRQAGWSRTGVRLFHFRTHLGREVDIVLEDSSGRIVGIEVKASATVGAEDFAGLTVLRETVGARFVRGIILYAGREAISFGRDMHVWPISAIWSV